MTHEKQEQDSTRDGIKNTPVEIVIADLKSKYQEIRQEHDPVQFFIKIAHYGKYISEKQVTTHLFTELYQEAQYDARPYILAWGEFINVWKVYAKDILEQARKAGIKDDNPLSNEIGSIESKLNNNEVSLWESDISNYFTCYRDLIKKFVIKGKSSLLTPKHFVALEGPLAIIDVYNKAGNEWDKFKQSRETKVWWAHYQICMLATGILDLGQRESYFKEDHVIDKFYKHEFSELTLGNLRGIPILLKQEKYTLWINRLHEYLLPRLENLRDGSEHSALMLDLNNRHKEPLHIVVDEVKKDIPIKGFEEKVVLQKPRNKIIQLRNFPPDLQWEEISIQFLNEHEVIIKARKETLQTTYEAMGFQDEKKKLPNKQWQFLRLLSIKNGEVSWENIRKLPLKQINSIKKQKQLLAEALKAYFQIYNGDPFRDYKTEKAYVIKLTLTPVPEQKDIDEREIYN